MNNLTQIKFEVTIVGCGFEYNYLSQDQVVKWADQWIEKEEEPITELAELSMMGTAKPIDVLGILYQLSYKPYSKRTIETRMGFIGLMWKEKILSIESAVTKIGKMIYEYELTEHLKNRIYSIDANYAIALHKGEGQISKVAGELDGLFASYIDVLEDQLSSIVD